MGGVVEVGGVLRVFDDEDEIGDAGGEFDGAFDAVAADHGGGDQDAFDALMGEDFGFADFGGAGADSTGGDTAAGDFATFVGFAVGAEGTSFGLREGGHFIDVGGEAIEIDAESGSGEVVDREFALDVAGGEEAFDFGPWAETGHLGMIAHAIS